MKTISGSLQGWACLLYTSGADVVVGADVAAVDLAGVIGPNTLIEDSTVDEGTSVTVSYTHLIGKAPPHLHHRL